MRTRHASSRQLYTVFLLLLLLVRSPPAAARLGGAAGWYLALAVAALALLLLTSLPHAFQGAIADALHRDVACDAPVLHGCMDGAMDGSMHACTDR